MRIELWSPDEDPISDQTMESVLQLVVHNLAPECICLIERWTRIERLVAYDWAMREHLRASDNYMVRRREEPSFVTALRVERRET